MTEPYAFRISVAELAEFCCRSGDLNLGMERSPTAQEGQEGQRKLQKDKPAHYQKEVQVQDHWSTPAFTCIITGRIDGLQLDSIPLLEEIKTTYCNEASLPAAQRAVHWAQLKLYAALLLPQLESETFRLQLRYLNLEDESQYQFEEMLSREALQDFYAHCKALSLQNQIIVLSATPSSFKKERKRPTCSSSAVIQPA